MHSHPQMWYAVIASRLICTSLRLDWSFTNFGAAFFGSKALRLDIVDVLRLDEASVCDLEWVAELEVCLVEAGMASGGLIMGLE